MIQEIFICGLQLCVLLEFTIFTNARTSAAWLVGLLPCQALPEGLQKMICKGFGAIKDRRRD